MLITLGYPRSGSTLVQFLLSHVRPIVKTKKLHGHDMMRHNAGAVSGSDKQLIMILRNYKECIMSHLTRDNNQDNLDIINQAMREYMKVLEVYEASDCSKWWIYYENLIKAPADTMSLVAGIFCFNMDHIISDIDTYMAASRRKYIKDLGMPQTNGTEAIHFTPLTQTQDLDWDGTMRNLNPELYDKYLRVYGDTNE